jgi:hypothetical protein
MDSKPCNHSFPFLCCHQGISVPRMAVEVESYLVLVAHLSFLVYITLYLFCLITLLQPLKCHKRKQCAGHRVPTFSTTKFYSSCVKVTPSREARYLDACT